MPETPQPFERERDTSSPSGALSGTTLAALNGEAGRSGLTVTHLLI
jgi:hypothetical protein